MRAIALTVRSLGRDFLFQCPPLPAQSLGTAEGTDTGEMLIDQIDGEANA